MKRRVFMLVGLVCLLVLTSAPAKQQQPDSKLYKPITEPRGPYTMDKTGDVVTPADMQAEEIEIMRRLLERTLERQQHAPLWWQSKVQPTAYSPLIAPLVLDSKSNNSTWLDLGFPYALQNITGEIKADGNWAQMAAQPYIAIQNVPGTASTRYTYATAYGGLPTTTNAYTYFAAGHGTERPGPEGIYLKGYGVIYTATLGLPTSPPVADSKQPTPKPLSEWERTRKELRGEKIESPKVAPHETLADAVLRVLAKNGQHFTQLADTEQVTVVLTLLRVGACTQCHGEKAAKPKSADPNAGPGDNAAAPAANPGRIQEDKLKTLKEAKAELQKQVLLGDLHMKQGQNEQAVTAFEAALKMYEAVLDFQRRLILDLKVAPAADVQMQKDYRLTAFKLLQVYTELGKKAEMQKVLKMIDANVEKASAAEEKKPSPPAEATAKEELPAKLVISAPKKLLDMAGSGKVTFEEFRKNATVEYQAPKMIER